MILLVEDDHWLAEMYQEALQAVGFTVDVASSAEKALDLVDKTKYQLIILDMYLPGHNGLELLHELGSYHDTGNIPVIVLSAVLQHEFGMSALRWQEYGVVGYHYKPTTKPEQLVAAVKKQFVAQGTPK